MYFRDCLGDKLRACDLEPEPNCAEPGMILIMYEAIEKKQSFVKFICSKAFKLTILDSSLDYCQYTVTYDIYKYAFVCPSLNSV